MTAQRTYTVGELRDLIAAKDADLAGVDAGRRVLPSEPDPTWDSDFGALGQRYADARSHAERYIEVVKAGDLGIFNPDNADATSEFVAILVALNSSATTLTVAPGSLVDMSRRLDLAAKAQNVVVPTWTVPQPTSDSGLNPGSWESYDVGLAYKLGFVDAKDVPPGTPGGPDADAPGGKPLIPTWLKWALGGTLAVTLAAKAKEILT